LEIIFENFTILERNLPQFEKVEETIGEFENHTILLGLEEDSVILN